MLSELDGVFVRIDGSRDRQFVKHLMAIKTYVEAAYFSIVTCVFLPGFMVL